MSKKQYVTKQQRKQFLRWLIDTYGYDTTHYYALNAQRLATEYKQSTNIELTKISVYRWIAGNNKQKYLNEVLDDIQQEYLVINNSQTDHSSNLSSG